MAVDSMEILDGARMKRTLSEALADRHLVLGVTARGARHLEELATMVASGHRAAMLYLVQRTDCTRFRLAADLDPAYARAVAAAREAGVEMLCYGTTITTEGVWLDAPIPLDTGELRFAGLSRA